MTIEVKTNAVEMSRIFKDMPVKTFPDLGQFIVNKMVFEGRKQGQQKIKKKFITRNRFTTQNILFEKSPKTKRLQDIQGKWGASDRIDYMRDQEEGVTLKPQRGSQLPVPTSLARVSTSIEKRKRGAFKIGSKGGGGIGRLRKISEMRGKTVKQRTIALIQDMLRKKQQANRLAILPFPNKPGVYKIASAGKEKKGAKTRFKYRLKMIYDLSRRSLKLKPQPWMEPVNKGLLKHQEKVAEAAFNRFIKTLKSPVVFK